MNLSDFNNEVEDAPIITIEHEGNIKYKLFGKGSLKINNDCIVIYRGIARRPYIIENNSLPEISKVQEGKYTLTISGKQYLIKTETLSCSYKCYNISKLMFMSKTFFTEQEDYLILNLTVLASILSFREWYLIRHSAATRKFSESYHSKNNLTLYYHHTDNVVDGIGIWDYEQGKPLSVIHKLKNTFSLTEP